MKLIIVDGLDNCGKTWTIDRIKDSKMLEKNNISYSTVHFPSDKICSTDVFKKLTKKNASYDTKIEFIQMLIDEEEAYLKNEIDKGTELVFIDRFIYSTLIYQGERTDEYDMNRIILDYYVKMFNRLNISHEDVFNYLFIHKIKDDEMETNESKIAFDNMRDILKFKMVKLLSDIETTYSEYMGYIRPYLFNENVLKIGSFSDSNLKIVSDNRVEKILSDILK